ncbi:response regulator transcription factor [Agriterribacter sp.]|uniref:response regulator transcription factor n=1 Tax=Agriterribacter sp. TaxID=2821509 RepID=UPI002CC41E16|nr:response regulator transcription factor [Agriterribacter sp.]HRO48049.1 response regulator transcription factor [Agriterribacter sp.]HRQ17268.1 response regulator transcription factor [Agriterribacter sp.]
MADSDKKIQVAVVDDHTLLRNALAKLIDSFDHFSVFFQAESGEELKEKLKKKYIPDIILLDVNMPGMNGFETAEWLFRNHPQIKVLALSMFSDENTIIRMLKSGAKGYIMKTAEPEELHLALESVVEKNFYLSEYITGKIVGGLNRDMEHPDEQVILTDKEVEFLKLTCSELSYKEIAERMFVSSRRVEDHRNVLFEKLKVRSRVGLVMYAIKKGIFEI